MSDTNHLTLGVIRDAVAGTAAAFRSVTELQPAGGTHATIFPPTYEGGKYAMVNYRSVKPDDCEEADIRVADRVLIDSVQAQANRMELALLRQWQTQRGDGDKFPLPVITVDFDGNNMQKVLRITSLEAPHRIADAILRDSLLDGTKFRASEVGQLLDHVDNQNAAPLFQYCPTALVFGMWDSTGPRGGLGAKFARALVSEIVGINAVIGKKTSSRIDPAQIMLQAGPLYQANNGGWTLDEAQAKKRRGKPVTMGKDGRPSEANHGNVTPSIEEGGVTIEKAIQTTVLSLPALRRLQFPVDGERDTARDNAARTALAALGICAATLARTDGDLRSRCQLFPTSPLVWELLDEPGVEPRQFTLPVDESTNLYRQAVGAAKEAGLPWMDDELVLAPSPELVALVQKSQELATSVAGGE